MPLTRKDFLKTTGAGALGLLIAPRLQASPMPPARAGFSLKVLATSWGFPGTVMAFFEKAKAAGYDGAEMWFPHEEKGQNEIFEAVEKTGMEVAFLCGASESDPKKNLAAFERVITTCARQQRRRPLYINCHSGKDYFSMADNGPFIELTTRLTKETGIPIYHETHRGKMLFAATITRDFIRKYPDLRLTLDISHWCNVHESLLADQAETINLALSRTEHIHARIGHPEGPQVNDPRAPEWKDAVDAHFGWWDTVVGRKREAGEVMTMLTEFGPPHYLPALPYTQQPVADQWDVNVYMMHTLRERYGK